MGIFNHSVIFEINHGTILFYEEKHVIVCDMYDYEQPKNKLNLYIFYYIVKLLFIIEPSCVMPESPTYEAHTVLATSDVYSGTTNVMDSFALWGSLFLIESRFSP